VAPGDFELVLNGGHLGDAKGGDAERIAMGGRVLELEVRMGHDGGDDGLGLSRIGAGFAPVVIGFRELVVDQTQGLAVAGGAGEDDEAIAIEEVV